MLWPRFFGGAQLQVPDFFQEARRAQMRVTESRRAQLRVTVRQLDVTRVTSRYVGSKVKGAGGKRPFLHLKDIMGEAPRARNTAQNTLTTWHADRLYGAMVIAGDSDRNEYSITAALSEI
eukprot:scaffold5081_cov106-Skeletonema_dohrnii-CCMP3373.AAC.2